MSITVTHLDIFEDAVARTAYTSSNSIAPPNTDIVFLTVASTRAGGNDTIPAITGTGGWSGLTWTEVDNEEISTVRRVWVLWALTTSTVTAGVITTTYDNTQDEFLLCIDELVGARSDAPVVQTATGTGFGTNMSATLLSFADATNNVTFGAFISDDAQNHTPGSGFTMLSGNNHKTTSPDLSEGVQFRVGEDTSVDQTHTTTSANWAAVAVEVDSSAGGSAGVTDLAFVGNDDIEVGLSWTVNADMTNLYRSTNPSFVPPSGTLVTSSLLGTETSYQDVNNSPGEKLYYRLTEADFSNPSNVPAVQMAPARPIDLFLTSQTDDSVSVSSINPPDATRTYNIWSYRTRDVRYMEMPGAAGDYISTTDSPALSVTGNIDIRCKAAPDDWTPAASPYFMSKRHTSGNRSYGFTLNTNGTIAAVWSADGSATVSGASTAATGITDGETYWVRYTLDVNNGAGGYDLTFYTSPDGVDWAQLGDVVVGGATTSIYDGNLDIHLGHNTTTTNQLIGKLYRVQIRDGIDGTIVGDFDTEQMEEGDTEYHDGTNLWTLSGATVMNDGPWTPHGTTDPIANYIYSGLPFPNTTYQFTVTSMNVPDLTQSGYAQTLEILVGTVLGDPEIIGDVTLTFDVNSPMVFVGTPAIVGDVTLIFNVGSAMTISVAAEEITSKLALDPSVHFGIDPLIGQDGDYDRESGMYIVDAMGLYRLMPVDFMPVEWAVDAVDNVRRPAIRLEPSATNIIDSSNDFDPATSDWGTLTSNFVSQTAVAGLLSDEIGWKLKKNGSSNGSAFQTNGTFSSDPESFSVLIERVDGPRFQWGIYNVDQAEFEVLGIYDYTTNAASLGTGFGSNQEVYVEKITDNGPNGGEVHLGTVSCVPQAPQTETRRMYIYPAGQGVVGTGASAIVHNTQLELDSRYSTSPIVTIGTTDTSRAVSSLSYPVPFDPSQRLTFYARIQDIGSGFSNPGENVKIFSVGSGANSGTSTLQVETGGGSYIDMPGSSGNYISTPDSPQVSVTGDLDLRARLAMDWTPGSTNSLMSKYTAGGTREWWFYIDAVGKLGIYVSENGTAVENQLATSAMGEVDDTAWWVRYTLDVDNGASGHVHTFYKSTDGVNWTTISSHIIAGVYSIADTSAQIEIGSVVSGTTSVLTGDIYQAQVYDGINGTLVADFSADGMGSGDTTYTDSLGNLWTLNGNTALNLTTGDGDKFRLRINNSTNTWVTSSLLPTTAVSALDTIELCVRYQPDTLNAIFEVAVNGDTPEKVTLSDIGSVASIFDANTMWINSFGGVNDIGCMRLFKLLVTEGISTLRQMRIRKHNAGGEFLY